jgi:hypothetical protein
MLAHMMTLGERNTWPRLVSTGAERGITSKWNDLVILTSISISMRAPLHLSRCQYLYCIQTTSELCSLFSITNAYTRSPQLPAAAPTSMNNMSAFEKVKLVLWRIRAAECVVLGEQPSLSSMAILYVRFAAPRSLIQTRPYRSGA